MCLIINKYKYLRTVGIICVIYFDVSDSLVSLEGGRKDPT